MGSVISGLREFSKKFLGTSFGYATLRNNIYIIPALAYSIGISVYYLLTGVALDYLPALVFLVAVCVMTVLSLKRKMGRYWISIISIMLSYEALQGTVGTVAAARGIFSLYPLDRLLWGFNLTGWVQTTFESPGMTTLASLFYSLHVPLVVATCVIIWFAKRALFGKYVTVMVLTTYAALATFIIIPTAPPWYSGAAANLYQSASAAIFPQGLSSLLSLVEVDKFAAFPSLHGAYAIIFSYFMIKIDRRLAVVAVPITAGIMLSTLYLGQHYLIDLIGGAAYALIPCLIAERFQIRFPGTQARKEGSGGGGATRPPAVMAAKSRAHAPGAPDSSPADERVARANGTTLLED